MTPYLERDGLTVYQGDCLTVLPLLSDASVHCCVTSPPYFGLRDYGCDGQIGLEPSPSEYVARLVEVFREVRRVLRDDGTLWLNLGDSYAANKAERTRSQSGECERPCAKATNPPAMSLPSGLKPKDLIGIPWRVAFALQAPYAVPSCVADEKNRSWLAAMFDGEGCIGIRRFDSYREEKQQVYQDGFVVYTVVANNDRELLDRCVDLTGFGSVKLKQRAASTDGRGIVSRRDSFGWRLDGNKAVEVIVAVYPYLIAKRKQACIAYTLDILNKNGHGSRAVPANVQDKKRRLWELIKQCNQRESVDLPDWIQEPKQIVEPGWYLRSDIIWAKPNPMPESVTDRPTKAHEYLFLLSKSERYHYDAGAVAEIALYPGDNRAERTDTRKVLDPMCADNGSRARTGKPTGETRNRRSVWTVATKPYSGAHFATFPPDLIKPCILAGCPAGGVVLDPFGGAGTTGLVAAENGCQSILIELNPEYCSLIARRLEQGVLF